MFTTKGPLFVVTRVPVRVKLTPVRWIPPIALVFKFWKVDVPLPAVWVIVAAVILPAVKLATLAIVRSPKRTVPPAAPVNVMLPEPAVRVKPPGPSTVLAKTILPPPAPALKALEALKTRGPLNWIRSFVVVIDPEDWEDPAPACVKGPSKESAPLEPNKNVPDTVTAAGPLAAVDRVLLIVRLVPVKLKPEAPLKLAAPLRVVVPVPAVWLKLADERAAKLTLLAPVIERM